MSKPWWSSKTIWVNAIALIASVTVAFGFDLGLTPEVQSHIVGGVMGVVNIALRFVTNTAIEK